MAASSKISAILPVVTSVAGTDKFVLAQGGAGTNTAITGASLKTDVLLGNATTATLATTVTTNANLTGDVTSVGNATTIASDVIVNADVKTNAAIATTKLSGALTSVTSHGLGAAALLATGVANGNVIVADATGLPVIDGSQLTNVVAPLTPSSLRGTDNPHIGAYPHQSFLVVDNPYLSTMLISDAAGNLQVVNSLGANTIAVGFSVQEDSTEPDIEVTSGGQTYSVISGDSDLLGASGLPVRQGFNNPDIGAFPAPLLISGGSIV